LRASEALVAAARVARDRALAPYSSFRVGAALQTTDGRIFTGCNIENASYGLTVCAERVAIWKALSEGARDFTALVVVADTPHPTPPCGACRQIIWEFCGDVTITLANMDGVTASHTAGHLLPWPFDRATFEPRS
jgi:cytidine deaminase